MPDIKEVDANHIYIAKRGEWYDEWYIVETEVDMISKVAVNEVSMDITDIKCDEMFEDDN